MSNKKDGYPTRNRRERDMTKNLLDSKFFDSRITSPNVTAKEKWIGFLIGPTGALLVNAILGGGFLNIF